MADDRQTDRSLVGALPQREIGFSGAQVWGGHVQDEFIRELAGVNGRKVYREMRENDSMIGAVFYALESLGASVDWRVDKGENGSEQDMEFLEQVFLGNDMDTSFDHFIRDTFTAMVFGWAYFEVTYKKRDQTETVNHRETDSYFNIGQEKLGSVRKPLSRFDDGKVGIAAISLRAQDTLWQWHMSEQGRTLGMTQMHPITGKHAKIPINKALHLVTRPNKGSPEGYSLLRNAYREWYSKRRIENIEVDGIDRDLTGLPTIYIPGEILRRAEQGDASAKKMVDEYRAMATEIRTNQSSGIVVPSDVWEGNDGRPSGVGKVRVELLASPGQRVIDIDAAIRRRDRGIARAILADFMTLGGEARGNFSLSRNLSSLFVTALESWFDNVEAEINRQIIPTLWTLNGLTTEPPLLKHGRVVPNDLEQLGTFLRDAVGMGVITLPDPNLENEVRGAAGMPEAPPPEEQERLKTEAAEMDVKAEKLKIKAGVMPDPTKQPMGQAGKPGMGQNKFGKPNKSSGGGLNKPGANSGSMNKPGGGNRPYKPAPPAKSQTKNRRPIK